jgi:drug/metabolite transporter (DMT)-like permease
VPDDIARFPGDARGARCPALAARGSAAGRRPLSLLEPALVYLGETFGLSMTSATDGAIISELEPALVVILAALVLGEAISRAGIVAVVAGLCGLAVLTGDAGGASGRHGTLGRRPDQLPIAVAPPGTGWLRRPSGVGGFALSFLIYNKVISAVNVG